MYREKYKIMHIRAQNWCAKVIECEEENEQLSARVRELEFEHEKILMKKDAEIDRLKSSLEDYKDRYAELKDLRKKSKHY